MIERKQGLTLYVFVEERSMQIVLEYVLPKLLPPGTKYNIIDFKGKGNLLKKLESRLKALAGDPKVRVIVLIDQDDDDCKELKALMEAAAKSARMETTASTKRATVWQVANRIVVKCLESWYCSDPKALSIAFPKLPFKRLSMLLKKTWPTDKELQQALRSEGYCRDALPKIELAQKLGPLLDPERESPNTSYTLFVDTVKSIFPHQRV